MISGKISKIIFMLKRYQYIYPLNIQKTIYCFQSVLVIHSINTYCVNSAKKDMDTLQHAQKNFEDKINKKMDTFLKDNRLKTYMDVINSEIAVFKESIRKDFTELREEVNGLRTSLEFSQSQIDDITKITKTVDLLDNRVESIQQQLDQSADLLDYLDNQMRRNNLRIEGVNEIESETWEKTENLVKLTLTDKLHFTPEEVSNMTIERAHRVRSTGTNNLSEHKPIVGYVQHNVHVIQIS